MTIWTPRLTDANAPIYRQIADQLQRDIDSGVLVAGSRLPTQRELAQLLGITVVTVTRAYNEAADRGLIDSHVGRGSFVRRVAVTEVAPGEVDLAANLVTGGTLELKKTVLERLSAALTVPYNCGAGTERHRTAGAAWVAHSGLKVSPGRMTLTSGTQHGILLALSAVARPGDVVLTESVTYHGAREAAAMLGIRLVGLACDRFGILPDALQSAAAKKTARALYLTPTLHNPTGAVMSEKRRKEIAAIAERYAMTLIEDDVYGFLAPGVPPIATLIPERTIYVTGMGKSLAPALRVGYLVAPEPLLGTIRSRLFASTLFASAVSAEAATSMIEDGTADAAVQQKQRSVALRQKLARNILGERAGRADVRSPHLWIELPSWWSADAFAAAAKANGVLVAPASAFATTADPPRAIRAAIAGPPSMSHLENGLHALVSLIGRRDSAHVAAIV